MKPILNFIDTWGVRVMFFVAIITFFKTCNTNSKVQDVNDSVDSLSVKLRKEIKTIKAELRTTNNGVYLSIGAIIIIILLLILIL